VASDLAGRGAQAAARHSTRVGAGDGSATLADASVGELIGSATEQFTRLVRAEMRLAQAELAEKGKHAGKGIGAFSTAGLLAFYGIGAGVAAAILGLSQVVDGWLAALIVMVALLLIAGVAALLGKKEVQQAKPVPERTVANVKADVAEIKGASHR
jgi:tetrahydromethanopterin S-methyltransferase subunit C